MSGIEAKPLNATPTVSPPANPTPSNPSPAVQSDPSAQTTPTPPSKGMPTSNPTDSPPTQNGHKQATLINKDRQIKALLTALQASEKKSTSLTKEKEYLLGENAQLMLRQGQLDATLKAYQQEIDQLKRINTEQEASRAAMEARLKVASEKDTEVAGLRDFLCLHNLSSESDVSHRLNHLNNVIEGVAQQLADQWVDTCRSSTNSFLRKDNNAYLGIVARRLGYKTVFQLLERVPGLTGRRLVTKLKSSPVHDELQLPLQWGFQTLIVKTVAYDCLDPFCFSSWVSDGPGEAALRRLSGDIQREAPQSSFGRWQSMTCKYLKQATPEADQQKAIDRLMEVAILWCYALISLVFKDRTPDLDTFVSGCKASMTEIFEEARKLVTMVREEVVTAQYESYVPLPGEAFDEALMVLDRNEKPEKDEVVVCTVRLGMTRSYKASRETTATVVKESFVKAEVVTRRILKEVG